MISCWAKVSDQAQGRLWSGDLAELLACRLLTGVYVVDDDLATPLARDLLNGYSFHLWQSGDMLLQSQAQGLGRHHSNGSSQDNLRQPGHA